MNQNKALNELEAVLGALDARSIANARQASEKISVQYGGELRRVVQMNMIAYDDF